MAQRLRTRCSAEPTPPQTCHYSMIERELGKSRGIDRVDGEAPRAARPGVVWRRSTPASPRSTDCRSTDGLPELPGRPPNRRCRGRERRASGAHGAWRGSSCRSFPCSLRRAAGALVWICTPPRATLAEVPRLDEDQCRAALRGLLTTSCSGPFTPNGASTSCRSLRRSTVTSSGSRSRHGEAESVSAIARRLVQHRTRILARDVAGRAL